MRVPRESYGRIHASMGETRTGPHVPMSEGEAVTPIGLQVGAHDIQGEFQARDRGAGQPCLVLGPELAWKAYRIEELEQLGTLSRVRREAEVALELAGVDGVLGANAMYEAGGWLVIEMARMAGTLASHLRARERLQEPPLDPTRYAQLIAGVGETLRTLHRRGIVHRDVKPANLLFTSDRARLLVADFSIVKTVSSAITRTGVALGTDSYIAPELWRGGESSPASDQYSLGIVATEVFSGRQTPVLPQPLTEVLKTATAVLPGDRFPGLDGTREFARALTAAVDAELPRTLADRLRFRPPQMRFAWAPAVLAALGYWVKVLLARDPSTIVGLETVLLPCLFGAVAYYAIRVLNSPRGRRRTQSGWIVLDLWWPPWLIIAAAFVLGRGFHSPVQLYLLIVPLGSHMQAHIQSVAATGYRVCSTAPPTS